MQRYCKPREMQNKTCFIFISEVKRSFYKETANREKCKIKPVLFSFPRGSVASIKIL